MEDTDWRPSKCPKCGEWREARRNPECANCDAPELKPCPFCGGVAGHETGRTGDGKPWHYVACGEVGCGAIGPTPPYADHNIRIMECCAEAWNTRASLPAGPGATQDSSSVAPRDD